MLTGLLEQVTGIEQVWTNLHSVEKSLIGVVVLICGYYFLRHIVIRRIERVTARTENDLDDRLIDFVKQFLWVFMLCRVCSKRNYSRYSFGYFSNH